MSDKIQELDKKLETASGQERIDILNELCALFSRKSLNKAVFYGLEALELARAADVPLSQIDASYQLGVAYFFASEYDLSLEYTQKALNLSQKANDIIRGAKALNLLGGIYMHFSDYETALDHYLHSLEFKEQIGDQAGIALCLNNIGLIYRNLGNYELALEYHLRGLAIEEELNNLRGVARSLNNLGLIYRHINELDKSLQYQTRALEIKKELGDQKGIGGLLNNIGNIYKHKKKYQKALDYYFEALHLYEDLDDKSGLALSLSNIGHLYHDLQDFEKSLDFYLQAIKLESDLKDKKGMALSLTNMGVAYLQLNDYDKSLLMLERGLEIAQEIESKEVITDTYKALADLFAVKKDYEKAFHYHQLYTEVKNEIFNNELSGKIAEMQTKYETDKKEKEIQLIRSQTEIYRLKNVELADAVAQLKELNTEKNEILDIVSHDLKNPISSILGITDMILSYGMKTFTKDELRQFIDDIRESSNRMFELVTNLLDANRLEAGKIDFEVKSFDLCFPVIQSISRHSHQAEEKQIRFKFEPPEKMVFASADLSATSQVIDNLVSNAVKYSPPNKNIYINVSENSHTVRCEVKDEGQGLTEKDKKQLFQKFARLSARPTGGEHSTGLGLSIVKRLVEAMNGKVWAESEGRNRGSSFIFELPKGS